MDLKKLPSNNKYNNRRPPQVELRGRARQKGSRGSGLANEVRDVFNSQFSSMMMPSIMRLIYDFLEGALRMIILGNRAGGSNRYGHTSYNNQYRGRQNNRTVYYGRGRDRGRQMARRVQETPYEDIYFDYQKDADDLLDIMRETIEEFGWVSVGHIYSVCGIKNNHTHHNWGWTDVNRVQVRSDDDGWFIDLPNPVSR